METTEPAWHEDPRDLAHDILIDCPDLDYYGAAQLEYDEMSNIRADVYPFNEEDVNGIWSEWTQEHRDLVRTKPTASDFNDALMDIIEGPGYECDKVVFHDRSLRPVPAQTQSPTQERTQAMADLEEALSTLQAIDEVVKSGEFTL